MAVRRSVICDYDNEDLSIVFNHISKDEDTMAQDLKLFKLQSSYFRDYMKFKDTFQTNLLCFKKQLKPKLDL